MHAPTHISLNGEAAQVEFGQRLGRALKERQAAFASTGFVVFLEGDLGAGKTTLVRGVLQGLGHQGAVKSPTYTLVEPYRFSNDSAELNAYHFDLYRLGEPEELEFIGWQDYFQSDSITLIEWPEKGEGVLPACDLFMALEYDDAGEQAGIGRKLVLSSNSDVAQTLVAEL